MLLVEVLDNRPKGMVGKVVSIFSKCLCGSRQILNAILTANMVVD